MDRTTSRLYGAIHGSIEIDQYDLGLIKQDAQRRLLDEQGFDVSRAWTNAVLAYLSSKKLLIEPNKGDLT